MDIFSQADRIVSNRLNLHYRKNYVTALKAMGQQGLVLHIGDHHVLTPKGRALALQSWAALPDNARVATFLFFKEAFSKK